MILTAGIDVGTSAIKAALVRSPEGSGRAREGAEIVATWHERIRRRDQVAVIESTWKAVLEAADCTPEDVAYVATTGEGELVAFRTGHFYGMTAHARGALFLEPRARFVLDVGALHTRALSMDDRSRVLAYRMTSQCASGSGQFLENIARYLGVTLEEVGPLSEQAESGERISSICAVLAETDVINMVSRGCDVRAILRGIHDSMAGRYAKLLRKLKPQAGDVVLVTGGLAADQGLVASLRRSLAELGLGSVEVVTHPLSLYAGAIGAALWGGYRHERLEELERERSAA